jgi:hypothetical protein
MRRFVTAALSALALFTLTISIGQTANTETTAEADLVRKLGLHQIKVTSESNVITAILTCLTKNEEAILLPHSVSCVGYREGLTLLADHLPGAPTGFVASRDCPSGKSSPQSFDARRLGADAIVKLLKPPITIGTHGIRILNAIFCDRVNLVGLDLPFSIVIDKSIFNAGIEIRNLRTKGDLSIDGSFLFEQFRMVRSHVEGSLFGDGTFIAGLSLGTSTIDGSVSLTESVLFRYTQFQNSRIGRELSVRASVLSFFIAQFSHVDDLIDLSYSEARCAYHINKSEIGFIVARGAGFGTIGTPDDELLNTRLKLYAWRGPFNDKVKTILGNSEVQLIVREKERCINEYDRPYRAEFFVFDSTIKSSLCVTNFKWLAPREDSSNYNDFTSADPRADDKLHTTTIAINGNTVGSNLIIDLWDSKRGIDDKVAKRLHIFEMIGLKTGGLIIDFDDSSRNQTITVDGLQFERLYHAQASCEYGGSPTEPPVSVDRYLSMIADFTEKLQLPKAKDALKWLDSNTIGSTQPYTVFATAFDNAGMDSTPITVAPENLQLCERAADWLAASLIRGYCEGALRRRENNNGGQTASRIPAPNLVVAASSTPIGGWHQLGATIVNMGEQLSELVQLVFQGALWLLADNGYRPGKVIWGVLVTLFVFWIWFLLPLRVVGYTAKAGPGGPEQQSLDYRDKFVGAVKLRPLGPLFLFDRLLPAYRIVQRNYEIDQFYKRAAATKSETVIAPGCSDCKENPLRIRKRLRG